MIAVQGPEGDRRARSHSIEAATLRSASDALLHVRERLRSTATTFSSAAPATPAKTASKSFATPNARREFGNASSTRGEDVGGMAAGLGARDTLRLEAAMPLYGHELSETINPIQAGLNFAVNLGGREFIGSEALERFAADKSQPVRVGLQLDGKRVAAPRLPRAARRRNRRRSHQRHVLAHVRTPDRDGLRPTHRPSHRHALAVDIRGTQHPAIVVPLPFYERGKKN